MKDVLNFPMGEIRSIIIKIQHNCTSDRRRYGKMEDVPIRHEYCVIFKKLALATLSYGSEPKEQAAHE
ncbi:MAG: hypothetical protein P8Z79_09740 [Sedimentisphaerales bacterium]